MKSIRRLLWTCLVLAFGQIVFGAIVRITGSGLGCGNHWPTCQGRLIPPLDRPDLIIEVTHRYIAAALTISIVALVMVTWARRRTPGVSGEGGVLWPAVTAFLLVVAAAMFGAVTVWLELANKAVIVTHLSIAMSLVAVLVAGLVRSTPRTEPGMAERGGPPPITTYAHVASHPSSFSRTPSRTNAGHVISPSTARTAAAASVLAFVILVLGALTANVPGANSACQGFPLCSGSFLPAESGQYLQFTHRIAAFVLFFLSGWLAIAATRRREGSVSRLARSAFALVTAQLVIAAVMVTRSLPPLWRSLHEATGTLLWIVLFAMAYTSRRASGSPARVSEARETAGQAMPATGVRV